MRPTDGFIFTNATADQTFELKGGAYGLIVHATFGGGSVDLQALAPDGATFVSVLSAVLTADGYAAVTVPPGQYRLHLTTATAVYASITRIPGE